MNTVADSILSGETIRAAYVLVTILLSGLVLFALLRGKSSLGLRVVMPVCTAVSVFAISRVVISGLESFGHGALGLVSFSLLNLIGFYCLAVSLGRLADKALPERSGSWLFPLDRSKLWKQTVFFGIGGAVLYLPVSGGASPGEFMLELLNLALIIATLRVVFFLLRGTFVMFGDHKFSLRGSIMLFSASWLVLEAIPLMSTTIALRAVGVAHLLDTAMLVFVIAGLTSKYVVMGDRLRNKASEATLEVDAAKAELTKLSNIAANIYEDSSDLIKKQKQQTLRYMKKAENLEKILQIGVNIQKRHELGDVLKMIVETIQENVGFNTVTLRLFNKKAQNFETRAYVGVADEEKDRIVNYRIPITEYQKMIEPRFRISKSYFVAKSNPWYGEDLASNESVLVEDSWRDIGMLIVPLLNENQVTVGYLSVENPENPKLAVADVIDTLESVATLAVIAIRNARFIKELEAKNEKLSVYADKLSGLNKLKANFVQTVSHEFRTPLTSIKAYCETLIKNADTVKRDLLKQFLYVIDEESSRLMTLIEDILDFSQMESGAIRFDKTPCTLQSLVKNANDELSNNFDAKRITLKCNLPERDMVVNGNCEMLKQLLVNLLHNASKFTKEEGNVWLTVRDDPGSVRVIVEDDGIGIPDGQLARIFDQFYQADNTTTRQHGGSGLGLAMCKSIIEWHDGRIWVENMLGAGARFVAVIPKKEVVVGSHIVDVASSVRRFEIERFLELLVENVAEFINVRKVSIMLIDTKRDELRIECAMGMDEEIVSNASVKSGEGISGKVAASGKAMLVSNIEEDPRVSQGNNDLSYPSKSFLCVPIKINRKVIGVVNVASPVGRPTLDKEDSRLLELLVERFSIAIGKMTTFADASARFEQVRETLKAILDSRRYIDSRYFDLVKSFALETVDRLGLGAEVRNKLHYLLNIYDLGLAKIGFHIIKNPKDLSPKDREEIHMHTLMGQEMLAALDEDSILRNIILSHHENFDGTGYPEQLKGEAIPIEARIIRVADSLRALVSNRPYQRQYTMEEAMEVLRHRSGTFFDPKVVEAFVEAMNQSRAEIGSGDTTPNRESDETVEEPS